ncbi:MAG: hypothetical protein H6711_04480 [Myxococcales bacterium]|nr:hypothetical protein [Myxococcales bacterium]
MSWAGLVAVALALVGAPAASAGVEPDAAPSPADADADPAEARGPWIAVALAEGDALAAEPLALTLSGHLADLGVTPTVEARGADEAIARRIAWARASLREGAEAAFWIAAAPAESPGEARLFLLHGDPARLYARPLALPEDPLERQEILGIVIRGLVDALLGRDAPLDMEEVALPEAEAERPAAAPPADAAAAAVGDEGAAPAEPAPPRARLLLGLGYAGSSFAGALPWGHGAALELGAITRPGIVVAGELGWIIHGVLTPTLGGAAYPDARLRLGRAGLGLRVGYAIRFGARRLGLVEPALVARGEAVIWWPQAGSRALRGAGMRVALGPAATLGVELGRGLALALRGELDLWVRNLDLAAHSSVGSVVVVRPPRVGASVLAGLRYAR